MATVAIEIPFNLTEEEVVLEPSAKGCTADEEMGWIVDHVPWESEELPRIMTAAVILHHKLNCTFGEALHTALIWERG